MQPPDHADRQAAFPIQHLCNARPRADERLQIPAREVLLLHPELDRLDRIGRIHRVVLGLIGIDQGCQYVEPVAIRRAAFRAAQRRSTSRRASSCCAGVRIGFAAFVMLDLRYIEPVIILMQTDPFDPDDALLEIMASTSRKAVPFTLKTIRSTVTMLAVA